MPWNMARFYSRLTPQVTQIPVAPPDRSLAPLNGTRIEVFGFSMGTPWQGVLRRKDFESVSFWNFKEGANLLIPQELNVRGDASILRMDPRMVRSFGPDALESEFALMNAEMYSTPDEVKWWKLPRQNAGPMTLVGLKGILCHKYGKIYAVSFGTMHGFQEGEPNVAPYKIALNLFDSDDRRYEISITGEEGKPLPLTQAQLNSMIASIQPDPKK